jgi:hypothetical protein
VGADDAEIVESHALLSVILCGQRVGSECSPPYRLLGIDVNTTSGGSFCSSWNAVQKLVKTAYTRSSLDIRIIMLQSFRTKYQDVQCGCRYVMRADYLVIQTLQNGQDRLVLAAK